MKIAILGASPAQVPTVLKVKEMGYEAIVIGRAEGAVADQYADKFYDMDISDFEGVTAICSKEGVCAVTSNQSEMPALAAAVVSERLGLHGIPSQIIRRVQDKSEVRKLTQQVEGLSKPWTFTVELDGETDIAQVASQVHQYPCIVKPCTASGKMGCSLCYHVEEFKEALTYAATRSTHILVEQYVGGVEISVETISHAGKHYVLQITDKENTGAPHFVEISHHQPSILPSALQQRIAAVTKRILDAVEYNEAVAHIEFKIDGDDIYLIEINPRGGGDFISSSLVGLSTGYDYMRAMINLSLGKFDEPEELHTEQYAGMYWLIGNVPDRVQAFQRALGCEWVKESHIGENMDKVLNSNVGRFSYIIYASDHKITLADCPKK